MNTQTIISAHPPVLAPYVSTHQPTYKFVSRAWLKPSRYTPAYYALIQFPDGRLDNVEFANIAEYEAYRDRIVSGITANHARTGIRLGCMCLHCSPKKAGRR